MSETRRCHRLVMNLPATFTLSGEFHETALATTVDVSGLGLCISTKKKLAIGQTVILELILDDKQKIKIQTQVIWVKEGHLASPADYSIGLQIDESMSLDEKQFLKFFSNRLITSSQKP